MNKAGGKWLKQRAAVHWINKHPRVIPDRGEAKWRDLQLPSLSWSSHAVTKAYRFSALWFEVKAKNPLVA
jgi:hypothetical protein